MVILENEQIRVEISELGAEIRRVTAHGREAMWSGDSSIWAGVAPLLFPICGGLQDDSFTHEGKNYTLEKHGFARKMRFELQQQGRYSAVFVLRESAETLAQYPWRFELKVSYTLRGACIEVGYEVNNTDERTMYCSIGSHEGFACPGGIEDYDVIFPQKETLSSYVLHGNLLAGDIVDIIRESDRIALYERYFEVDALVFKDLKSRSATLRNRKTGVSVSVDFDGFDYFLLWHKPDAEYICLEPWCGIPASVGDSTEIAEKEGIQTIRPSRALKLKHTLWF